MNEPLREDRSTWSREPTSESPEGGPVSIVSGSAFVGENKDELSAMDVPQFGQVRRPEPHRLRVSEGSSPKVSR